MPPPPSGLPFNAQPQLNDISNVSLYSVKTVHFCKMISFQFPPKEYFHNYNTDPDIKRDMEEVISLTYTLSVVNNFF